MGGCCQRDGSPQDLNQAILQSLQGETPRRGLRREDQPAQSGGMRLRGGLPQDRARRAPRARPKNQHGTHGQETALHGQGRNIEHLIAFVGYELI